MPKVYTQQDLEKIVEIFNSYPGNNTYAAKQAEKVLGRNYKNVLKKYRKIRCAYPTQKVISATGISTPNGITRWTAKDVPVFEKIRRFNNIKHLLFS